MGFDKLWEQCSKYNIEYNYNKETNESIVISYISMPKHIYNTMHPKNYTDFYKNIE